MILLNTQYNLLISNIRSYLVASDAAINPEILKYLVDSTKQQINLLPKHFYWVFILFLNTILFLLFCLPRVFHKTCLNILRTIPGFSAVFYYHEKMVAASDLEFFQKNGVLTSKRIETIN